jgi:hypothetical protein
MKYPESARPARPTHPDFGGFRAIQGYASVTCSDWHAFHLWQADDPGFTGVVTVLDHQGEQLTMVDRPVPTDQAADRSLERFGWRRVGPWDRTDGVTAAHRCPGTERLSSASVGH